ncbi:MAG: hypothetical protein JSW38_09160 [Dehalococcoidia bacterium]|nr:MAG: hypothetical protein JSW38_09160 [Dehalococcoidia bacterium]
MKDNLELIEAVIDQHRDIREHASAVGAMISDQDALMALEKARSDWTPGRFEALSEKRNGLRQLLSQLDEGIHRHFDFEERELPPLLGDLMMHALKLDHTEIEREIGEAGKMIIDMPLDDSNRDELLAGESRIQQRIGVVLQLIEEHAIREETILVMIQRALEDR